MLECVNESWRILSFILNEKPTLINEYGLFLDVVPPGLEPGTN